MFLHVGICEGKDLLHPNPHEYISTVRNTKDKDGKQDSVNK